MESRLIEITNLGRQYEEIKHVLMPRLDSVYSQNQHLEGQWMLDCEDKLKQLTGRKHARMVTSGTSAITLMCLALGIKHGDKIVVINHSIPNSVMPLKLLGADLIFTDLNRHGQQDLSNIPVSGVKAIMTTGLYGDCPDHDLVADTGVPIINDSCQAFLSKYKGKEATSIGDASAISFAQNKNCPVFGTYGAVLTDNDDWNDQFSYLRRCGYVSKGDGTLGGVGINAQPHADKCVQVYTALEFVDKWQARRQEVAQRLKEGLRDTGVRLRTSPDYSTTNNHKFVLFVKQNTEFMKKLAGFGIQSQLHYRYNFANNKILNTGEAKDFPMTDFFNKHAITIPSNPWLTTAEVGRIIEAVKNSLTKHDLEIAI